MTAPATPPQAAVRITERTPAHVLEVTAFGYPPPAAFDDWPRAPGAATRAADGAVTRLHHAPGRWLVPEPDATLRAALAHVAAAGAVAEVDGKWRALRVDGPGARRLLASALDPDAVLAGRDGAATVVFDCPVLLVTVPGGFELWVPGSYARHLSTQLGTVDRVLAAR